MNNTIIARFYIKGERQLIIVQGDLTQERVDAIVNAANEHLIHGGGVAGAIVRGGGEIIQDESDEWIRKHGPVTHTKPAYTSAGDLPCQHVIHAVGPIWGSGDEDRKLSEAIMGSLALADELNLESIAYPAISTGIFGFPTDRAAEVILFAIQEYFNQNLASGLVQVRLTLFEEKKVQIFLKTCASLGLRAHES